jgi:ABC-type nitrate/sulfonate/bicarbonate transport system permease component
VVPYEIAVAVGFAFTGTVVDECVISSRGMGYQLQFAPSRGSTELL